MWIFLVLVAIAVLVIRRFLSTYYEFWRDKNVPHPPVNILFGNCAEAVFMKKSLGEVVTDIYNGYKDLLYVGFYRMRTPSIVVRDPELIKSITVKDFSSFHDNDVEVDEKIDPMFAKNPFAVHGPKWKVVRNQITPCFTSGKMKAMFPIMQGTAKKLTDYLENEPEATGPNGLETKELSAKFTTENVVSSSFGLDANCFTDPKNLFRQMGMDMMHPDLIIGIKHMLIFIMPSLAAFLHVKFVPDNVANYFRNLIKEIQQYRKEKNLKRYDFIDNLLEIKAKDPTFQDEDLAAHAVGLFGDGFETSSIALSFTLYELAANPDAQAKLREEIDAVIGRGEVTYEAVQEMAYLDAVICEALRKHPPGLFLLKKCTQTYTLPPPTKNSPSKGVTIHPGVSIILPVYALHHDPTHYPEPEQFKPERFLGEARSDINKYAYLPFGEGQRACLGQRFALIQIKVAIFNVIANYEIRVNPKTITPIQIDPTYFMMAAKGGLWLNYYKRKH